MGEAVGLSGSATPSVVDLSKLPPPPAAELPKVVTPAADLPVAATPTTAAAAPAAEFPAPVTPTIPDQSDGCPLLCWLPFELLVGGGKGTSVGFSVNGAAPAINYDDSFSGMVRGSVFLTPVSFGQKWQYNTQAFAFGQADAFGDPLGKIWSVGVGAAARLSYAMRYGAVAVAADLAGSLGILWMEKMTDVGIPGKLYWAADSYQFPQIHSGISVYYDLPPLGMSTPKKELKMTIGLRTGARFVFHKSHVTNAPAGMPQDTVVGLESPIWEVIQGVLGIHF